MPKIECYYTVDDPLKQYYSFSVQNSAESISVTFPLYNSQTDSRLGTLKLNVDSVNPDLDESLNTYVYTFYIDQDPPLAITSQYALAVGPKTVFPPIKMRIQSISSSDPAVQCSSGYVSVQPVQFRRNVKISYS